MEIQAEAVADAAAAAPHVKGESLSADLSHILNDPSFSDLALVTKDGDRIPVYRIILAARSPVFHSMFMNGMSESGVNVKEVQLPAITTTTLLFILEYIYTGSLSKHSLSVDTVYDVIHGARFFLLPKLELIALEYSKEVEVQDVHVATKCLSRAVEVLSVEQDEPMLLEFVWILEKSDLEASHLSNLSPQALRYFLEKTSNLSIRFFVSEYIRLRCAILWCACALSKEAEAVVSAYLPPKHVVLILINRRRSLERYYPDGDAVLQPKVEEFRAALTVSLRSWLPLINLSQIHPQLLRRVIEPLGIIPPQDLSQAFSFQALYSMDMILLGWKHGAHGNFYSIDEEGWVIESTCKNNAYGYARAALAITKRIGKYEWDFIVEETCSYLGVGICCIEEAYQMENNEPGLGRQSFGWVLLSTGHLQHHTSVDGKIKYGQAFGRDSRVRVLLDMEKGTCSFAIDGEKYGVAWENLPAELYPAVTFGAPGRVRIELVGGFK